MATYTYDATTGTYILSADQLFAVTTDQLDYAPGTTADISATGFSAGDIVEITAQVVEADGTLDAITFDTTVTVGSDGTATTTMWIDPALYTNQNILLTATDTTAGVMATESFADAPVPEPAVPAGVTAIDLTVAATQTPLTAGAIWANQGSPIDTPVASTGTGQFNTFSRLQANGTEQGFNTDANPNLEGLDEKASPHTHSLLLSSLQTVDSTGAPSTTGAFYEFKLDIDQAGSSPYLSLDSLKIYQASTGDLVSLSSGATLDYDLNGLNGGNGTESVLLNAALGAGSGNGNTQASDLIVLIPTNDFNAASGKYVYLDSAFGGLSPNWAANGGFEEWGALANTNATGSTPFAAVGVDKQISVDGGATWLDQHLYVPTTSSAYAPTLLAGSTVDYQVLVTNETILNASDPNPAVAVTSVSDLNGPPLTAVTDGSHPFNIGDTNNDGLIQIGETWVYTGHISAVDGLQLDTVTVVGTVSDSNGVTTDSESDSANYIGVTPKIAIDKVTVDGTLDASGNLLTGAQGDALTILKGEPIIWEYKVTDAGDTPLSNVTVTDNQSGVTPTALLGADLLHNVGDTNNDGILENGETWIYTAAGTAIDGTYTNTGHATGSFTDSAGHMATPSADDGSGYTGVLPAIAIDKVTVDGTLDVSGNLLTGAEGDALTILKGEPIIWEYKVTDVGDTPLSNVTVTDNQSGATPTALLGADLVHNVGDTNNDGILENGETWIYTATGIAAVGAYSNIGTASGSFTDTAGHTATPSATDPSSYFGADPEISINKITISGDQSGDGITAIVGASVTWQYTVTNTGNEALSGVTVTDSVNGVHPVYVSGDTNDNGMLDLTETWIYTASGTVVAGAYSNVGTASGSFTDTADHVGTDTSTDPSSYTGLALGTSGLTQGFWANHSAAWDGKPDVTWGNIVDKAGGLWGDAFTLSSVAVTQQGKQFTGNDDILYGLNGHGGGGFAGDVLLGDANGNGAINPGEVTQLLTNAKALGDLTTSAGGNAQTIILSQLVAAQLNIYNGDQDPGVANLAAPNAGHDLVGEAVQWLAGTLKGEGSASTSTSGFQWNNKFFDTGIVNPNSATNSDIMVSGQDIKNVLQAFNQDQIVTSKDGSLIGWSDNGGVTVVGVHANITDEFWLVALQHGVITG